MLIILWKILNICERYKWKIWQFSNSNYVSATEAHDDDGLPHTLEHIVFMGSEKYPYKVWSHITFSVI